MQEQRKLVLFIIFLVITSQLALTIYLPSMPEMVTALHTDAAHIKSSMTIYLFGYGISQFVYGPLSDVFGRRKIILWGLSIFLIATSICLLANSIAIFLLGRLIQGVGIGCGDTMGRAILCDRFENQAFVRAACVIGFAATFTPMLGPLLGGYIEYYLNWRINFFIILIYTAILITFAFLYLHETKAPHHIMQRQIKNILKTYFRILTNRTFVLYFIPGALCFVGEIIYNMQSPFLLQNKIGWDAVSFGWLNVCIIIGLLTGTFIANVCSERVSYQRMVLIGMYLLTSSAFLMLIPALFNIINTVVIIAPMFVFMMGVGIVYPNTNTGALTPFSSGAAGTAGALQGGLQMVLGGVFGAILGHIPAATQLSLAITLSLIGLASFILFIVLLRPVKRT